MQSLLNLIVRNRIVLVFFFLELISVWLIFTKNPFQYNAFFTSANYISGQTYELKNSVTKYFNLVVKNTLLQEENAKLMSLLEALNAKNKLENIININDSIIMNKVDIIPAYVLQNSTAKANNYFVLNRGKLDGIEKGMGVYNEKGAVGIVRSVSDYYSSVYSLLHQDLLISAIHKKSGELCSIQWGNKNIFKSSILYLPKHVNILLGDTLITSGYSESFIKGIPIGTISQVESYTNKTFYNLELEFFPNFNALNHVYIIKNRSNKTWNDLIKE